MSSARKLASEIAALLSFDPIAAAQIKDYIKPDELAALLEIRIVEINYVERPEENLSIKELMIGYENDEILDFIITRYELSEILEAYRVAKIKSGSAFRFSAQPKNLA